MEKQTLNISKDGLLGLLSKIDRNQTINLVTETFLNFRSDFSPFYKKVVKRCNRNYMINNFYQNRVRNNEVKEGLNGDFISQSLRGKYHITKCLLSDIKTSSKYYLMVEYFDEIKPIDEQWYIIEDVTLYNVVYKGIKYRQLEVGKGLITDSEIKNLIYGDLKEKSLYNSQPQSRKVKVLTINVDNIKEISLEGNKYIIK